MGGKSLFQWQRDQARDGSEADLDEQDAPDGPEPKAEPEPSGCHEAETDEHQQRQGIRRRDQEVEKFREREEHRGADSRDGSEVIQQGAACCPASSPTIVQPAIACVFLFHRLCPRGGRGPSRCA